MTHQVGICLTSFSAVAQTRYFCLYLKEVYLFVMFRSRRNTLGGFIQIHQSLTNPHHFWCKQLLICRQGETKALLGAGCSCMFKCQLLFLVLPVHAEGERALCWCQDFVPVSIFICWCWMNQQPIKFYQGWTNKTERTQGCCNSLTE